MTPDQRQLWDQLIEARSYAGRVLAERTVPEVVPIVKVVLAAGGPGLDTALRVLEGMPDERLMEVFPQLLSAALAPGRHAAQARQLLARLDGGWLSFSLGLETERLVRERRRGTLAQLEGLVAYLGQTELLTRVRDALSTLQAADADQPTSGEPTATAPTTAELTPDQTQWWARVRDAESRAIAARRQLGPHDTIAVLQETLVDGAQRASALGVARHLQDDQLRQLLPQLYESATITHRSLLLNRDLVARMGRDWLAAELPPLVERTLATGDEEGYRRLAELLDHLGLHALLARLVEAAAASDDEEIREVADDFGRGIPIHDGPTAGDD